MSSRGSPRSPRAGLGSRGSSPTTRSSSTCACRPDRSPAISCAWCSIDRPIRRVRRNGSGSCGCFSKRSVTRRRGASSTVSSVTSPRCRTSPKNGGAWGNCRPPGSSTRSDCAAGRARMPWRWRSSNASPPTRPRPKPSRRSGRPVMPTAGARHRPNACSGSSRSGVTASRMAAPGPPSPESSTRSARR